jgi:hypothetical protein
MLLSLEVIAETVKICVNEKCLNKKHNLLKKLYSKRAKQKKKAS